MWARAAFTCVVAGLVAAAFVGCGSDDEENPARPTTDAACTALCDKQAAAMCGLDPADCQDLCSFVRETSQCESRFRAYIDCQDGLGNVCDTMSCLNPLASAYQCAFPDAGPG